MQRREALKNVAFLLGSAVSATTLSIVLDGCKSGTGKKTGELFTEEQNKLVDEIADTIIPTTSTPGAKAAGVGSFVTMMVKECYPENVQNDFLKGLDDADSRSKKDFNKAFTALSAEQRNQVLKAIADDTIQQKKDDKGKEQKDKSKKAADKSKYEAKVYFFQLIRELTLLGYFTSEIGAKQALAYVAIPGRYDGCVDLKPGQKAWAM